MSTTTTLESPQLQAPVLKAAVAPAPRTDAYGVQLLLLLLTLLTTTLIGMRYAYDFQLGRAPLTSSTDILPYQWAWDHLDLYANGLPFSLTNSS